MAMIRITSIVNPVLLVRAFNNAGSGLIHALKSERAVQQEVILIIAGVAAALLLTEIAIERALLIGSLGVVLIVELLNSAIETTIDRIGPEHNPLSKQAKDLGSAAVLISLVTAAAMWIIILV
ncbi:MAG: diacylglycerol kinase [Dehalococcoidia bacterium]